MQISPFSTRLQVLDQNVILSNDIYTLVTADWLAGLAGCISALLPAWLVNPAYIS